VAILDKLGINGQDKELMRYAAFLHDIGKLSIPKEILLAPRRLTDKEFELVKDHPVIGYKKLLHIKPLTDVNPVIMYHHYRNGFGYPKKIENVPMPDTVLIDVLTVADSYSAIREKRIYNVWNLEHMDAISLLKNEDDPKNKGINQEIVDILSKINTAGL
jgi:HD-GYP domain-containing protein (c-di-GMP phosphodiesterase class II)